MKHARRPAVGSITELKTRTNPSADKSERWQNSGVQSRYRNSLLYMLQFTTTSINNATFTAARISKLIAP
jgi:hypothetical protein